MAEARIEVVIYNQDDEMCAILADSIRDLAGLEIESICLFDKLLSRFKEPLSLLVVEAHRLSEALWNQVKQQPCRLLLLANRMTDEEWTQLQAKGASDYLLLPFDRAAFIGRVRKLIAPTQPLKLCEKSYDVFVHGERVHLTPHEFKLLKVLTAKSGSVFSRDELIASVQGDGIVVVDRAIDAHVFSLRKKLKSLGESIETVRGEGYRWGV